MNSFNKVVHCAGVKRSNVNFDKRIRLRLRSIITLHRPWECSCRPTSKASLSFDELVDRHARYCDTRSQIYVTMKKLMWHNSVIIKKSNLPCRCLDVAIIWRYRITRSCALTRCPFPGSIKGLVKALCNPSCSVVFLSTYMYTVQDF